MGMNIDITGRHVDVTSALREFTHDKLRKLERVMDGPLDVHVVLAIEKHRHMAEIQVKSRTAVFSGTTETDDLYASISNATDKLERQALKHKQKLHSHKHRKGPRDPESAATIEANATVVDEDASPPSPPPPRIELSNSYRVKPLSTEDALLELEGNDDDLLVFRDAESGRVCVIHRKKDGNFGLVQPDF